LVESGLPASRLEIELTESALVDNLELARRVVSELKAGAVRLALDDFGTGYSSLRHLQALPFDKIKVDAGFVRSMVSNPESRKIVAAVIGLGHSLGLPIVAEGVEDAPTAEALAGMGCDIGQGWLFGRPMPEAEAMALAIAKARHRRRRARPPPDRPSNPAAPCPAPAAGGVDASSRGKVEGGGRVPRRRRGTAMGAVAPTSRGPPCR
jgi:EAL domain-containing protein (putative c-di-GMP-specific phosphodiesterase class I)